MLNELISHQERMYGLITDRMRALSDIQKQAAETRNTLIQGDVQQEKLAALDEALRQMYEMRLQIDAEKLEVECKRSIIKRVSGWVKPLENGYGYSTQFPKHCWDGFYAILNYLPAEQRKAIRDIKLTEEDLASDGVKNGEDVFLGTPNVVTLGQWLEEYAPSCVYPKQGTPLHSRFVDDVFPKIAAAIDVIEAAYQKRIDGLFTKKMDAVKEMAGLSK